MLVFLLYNKDMEEEDDKDLKLLDEELSDSDRDDGDMLACGE